MALFGINPLDSDNASVEYLGIVYSIIRRVNYYISGPSDPKVVENSVLGDLCALLALCKTDKMAGQAIAKEQVAEWRKVFFDWLDDPRRKIPKKYFDGYKKTVCKLFDELEELAVKLPRDFWHTKAHPQGMS